MVLTPNSFMGVGGLLLPPSPCSQKTPMNYHEYIASEEWKLIADKIKKRDGCCLICGTKLHLNVHHGSYEHLGAELDDELFTLCRFHHEQLHKQHKGSKKKKKNTLLIHTESFIRKNKIQPRLTNNFTSILEVMQERYKKEPVAPAVPFQFKSKNQIRLEEIRAKKAEKRAAKKKRKAERMAAPPKMVKSDELIPRGYYKRVLARGDN